jgi:hypothetical protein
MFGSGSSALAMAKDDRTAPRRLPGGMSPTTPEQAALHHVAGIRGTASFGVLEPLAQVLSQQMPLAEVQDPHALRPSVRAYAGGRFRPARPPLCDRWPARQRTPTPPNPQNEPTLPDDCRLKRRSSRPTSPHSACSVLQNEQTTLPRWSSPATAPISDGRRPGSRDLPEPDPAPLAPGQVPGFSNRLTNLLTEAAEPERSRS